MSKDLALSTLESTRDGLTTAEVKKRQALFGPNAITERHRLNALRIFFSQFKSPLILMLVAATVITLVLQEWLDASVLAATIFANAGLGFWQENKAETVLENLKSYIRTRTRVRRSGREQEINATELVPGDVIRIAQGDRVPADGRILFEQAFQTDESVITGESLPVDKHTEPVARTAALGDRNGMVLSGTLAVQGLADVLVTATNDFTEFGRIASMVSERELETTPLQKIVSKFATRASIGLGILTLILFTIGLLSGADPFAMFFIAVAVAVSAVPEGLPISLTVILAVGVERLAKKNGVVRKLMAAETLGSTSLILTDKTGTLTKAEMRLTDVIPYGNGTGAEEYLLVGALLNTDVAIENPEQDPSKWILAGRAMESALVRDAASRGIRLPDVLRGVRISDRLPFNSRQKYSAVVVEEKGSRHLFVLGAPEILLGLCTLPTTEAERLRAEIERRARTGERLLGLAESSVDPNFTCKSGTRLCDLSFKGLLALRDPIRPGVKEAITRIAATGVRTVVVTGDHQGTAESVAREVGILDGKGTVMTGAELDTLPEGELLKRLDHIRVFARMTPEHKLRLTNLYKSKGEVVAVTGDGVNDAPALKAADVGVAVGTGTEAAKGAADLVILDDDFETIVIAIEEGRRILQNMRKAIVYLLSNAFSELVLIGGSLLMGIPLPLTAIQILYVNFFSDSFPAIGLAFEASTSDDVAKPTSVKRLLDHQMRFLIVIVGGALSVSLFILYAFLLSQGYAPELVRTFIFAAFGTYALFAAFAVRSLQTSTWLSNPFSNPFLFAGVAIGVVLMMGAIYFPPLQMILGTIALPWPWLVGVFAIAALNMIGIELGKKLYRGAQA